MHRPLNNFEFDNLKIIGWNWSAAAVSWVSFARTGRCRPCRWQSLVSSTTCFPFRVPVLWFEEKAGADSAHFEKCVTSKRSRLCSS